MTTTHSKPSASKSPWVYIFISTITALIAALAHQYGWIWSCKADLECEEIARRIDIVKQDTEFVRRRIALTQNTTIGEEVILDAWLVSVERALDKAIAEYDVVHTEAEERLMPTVHIMTILRGPESFGELRDFHNHMDQINRQEYPRHRVSLSFLVSEDTYYRYIKKTLPKLAKGYARLSVVHRDFYWSTGRADHERHDASVQQVRRSYLAQYRNQLFYLTYNDEDYVFWIDADMMDLPPDTISTLVSANRDVVVPRCMRQGKEYDLNAWLGRRTKPQAKSFYAYFVPQPADGPDGAIHMDVLANLTDARIVPLHSVGGTALMVRSDVHLKGAIFPPMYIIGSDWDTVGGYDGIETEGICYVARVLNDTCWGLLDHYVEHHWE